MPAPRTLPRSTVSTGLSPLASLRLQGFMSESMDQFAQDVVFPAFTPTLGLFLAISTGYGLWKVRGREDERGCPPRLPAGSIPCPAS